MFLLLIVLLLVCIIFYIKKTTCYWNQRNIIGPKPTSFFGNIKASVLHQKPLQIIYQDIYNDFPDEKIVGVYTMMSPALLIRDLEIVKHIMVKDFNCFTERGLMINKKKLGDNLFHCDSKTWQVLRSKITPFFSSFKLRNSFNIMLKCGDRLVEYIEKESQIKPEQELHHLFRKLGMAATLGGIFFLDVDPYNSDNDAFLERLDKSIFTKSHISEMNRHFPDLMNMTNTSVFGETAVKFCNDIVKNAVDQRKDNSANKNCIINMLLDLKDTVKACSGKGDKKDFEITDHVIASQFFILFATGYEGANLSLSYAFYHLARNIDIQDRLIKQMDDILKKHNRLLTYDALNEMTYIEQVFYETLRLNPFTSTIQRVAMVDYTIPGTNIEIEKGVTVLISPLAIHRDKKYYKDPLIFDPERFNPENNAIRNPCAFLPFGLGPRSCIGYRFTKLLFKVAMVKILTKFMVRPSEPIREEKIDPCRTMLAMKGGTIIVLARENPLICLD